MPPAPPDSRNYDDMSIALPSANLGPGGCGWRRGRQGPGRWPAGRVPWGSLAFDVHHEVGSANHDFVAAHQLLRIAAAYENAVARVQIGQN